MKRLLQWLTTAMLLAPFGLAMVQSCRNQEEPLAEEMAPPLPMHQEHQKAHADPDETEPTPSP